MSDTSEPILDTIKRLPATEITATLRSPRGSATRTFKGATLHAYTRAIGLTPAASPIGLGNYYFVATAEDGFRVSLAYFEITPRATDKQVLLAYEQDGETIRAGVRLVVPGDDLGGRSIFGVSQVELKAVAKAEPAPAGSTLVVGGRVELPLELSLQDLSQFPMHEAVANAIPSQHDETARPHRYAGVSLWDVLEAAKPIVDPAINEDIMRRVVVARSTDGNAAVVAPGEIDPRFMGGDVMIATETDGKPIGEAGGFFRLVVVYDKTIGRALKSLGSIEVIEA